MTPSEKKPGIVGRREDIGYSTTDTMPLHAVSSGHAWDESELPWPTEAIALAPGDSIGQYEVIRLLGSGGMGQVHLARDLRLGRLVALKRMISQSPQRNQRFLDEARATARCHHENIVVIHEVGEHQGHPYMVLEYLEGQTLRQWLRGHTAATAAAGQRAPVPPGRAVELMLPVVRALAYAHERGIVHRDLKPENIVLTRGGTIKVLDFGLAKLLPGPTPDELSQEQGRAGTAEVHCSALIGTLPYMSPEQMRVGVIDHRTDLWAVGIMLFEMVAGAHPVPSRAKVALLRVAYEKTPMPSVREQMRDISPLADIIDRCLIKDKEHRTATARDLLHELEALLPVQRTRTRDQDSNPFAGLAPFQELDADRFFGRDHDIDSLVGKLRSVPLVAVTGPSGAGKSSLVRAGVIPTLKRSGEGWEAMVMRPGRQPLAALAEVLLALPGSSSELHAIHGVARGAAQESADRDAIVGRLCAEPGYLGIVLRSWARAKLRRLVLFVDQFEELYTLGADAGERACMLTCLGVVADDVASPLRVILSVRSDFLDRLVEQRAFLDTVSHGLTFLAPLDRGGLREALTRPVEACEHRFESQEMIERILDELEASRCPLPLLQFTADALWARRDHQQLVLTTSSLEALGGVSGALASHADAVLASMPAHDVRLVRAVFLRLVTPERTRALATLAEVRQLGRTPADMDRVLTWLIEARLLVVERSAAGTCSGAGEVVADGMVEIVHESLIDTWPLLARWLVESEEDAVFLTRLRSAARDWERSGHAPGLLWSGAAAREAWDWQERHQGELAPGEERYLAAVLAAAERSRRRHRQLFGGSLAAAMAVAMVMAWLAWQESRASQAAAHAAAEARQEAMRARDASRMAVIRSLPEDPTAQLAVLREIEARYAPPLGATWEAQRLLGAGLTTDVLMGHDGVVVSAELSPDGTRVVSASFDKTVRVWPVDGSGVPVVLRGHDDVVVSAEFSPDGTRIVSASSDKTVRVWPVDGSGVPVVLSGHDDGVSSAKFSPDGTRIVSASADKTVRVWPSDGSSAPTVLRGHDYDVLSAEFSPDGTRIVSASLDKTVRVWPADGSGEPTVLRGHDALVFSAVFSPDGTRIFSASADRTIRVWPVDYSSTPTVLGGHDGMVMSLALSPDGHRLVSVSWDRTVRMWQVDGSSAPAVLRGHDDGVSSAAFSPDGTRIVSASADKTVRVWPVDDSGASMALRGHDALVFSAEFSPDGTRIVSASRDKTVRVWPADGAGASTVLRGHDGIVSSAAFSPDGTRIVSASWDKTVRVWPADGAGAPTVLRGHDDVVSSAAFSPDGTRIVSASFDKTVRVWPADGAGAPTVLRGHDDLVFSAVFSPDGTRIVSASMDKTVRVWPSDGSGTPTILRGHDDAVSWAEFRPDGKQIVSASPDRTIRIWPANGTMEPVVLTVPSLATSQARFSPDGRRIVSASDDGTVRVWHDLEPVRLDDPRLWTATSYCMPVERRVQLLGVTEAAARQDRQRCIERVEQARRSEAPR